MKVFKAFKKGSIRGENEVVFYEKGTPVYSDPLDVFDVYPFVDKNGEMSDFAEMETLDEAMLAVKGKYYSKKLKIEKRIKFLELVLRHKDIFFKNIEETTVKPTNEADEKIYISHYNAKIRSSGINAQIFSKASYAEIYSSGNSAKIWAHTENPKIYSSGYNALIAALNDTAKIHSNGYKAKIYSNGYKTLINSSGSSAEICSEGNFSSILSVGEEARIFSSGNYTQITSSGDNAIINSKGKGAVICCTGINSIAKGKLGSVITLTEWADPTYKRDKVIKALKESDYIPTAAVYIPIPVCVKTEKIDGVKIKEDTFYKIENGEFVEVKQ